MKIRHKVNVSRLKPKQEPISERYEAEIERALQRAEKACRRADRRRLRAEREYGQQPTPSKRQVWEAVCAEVERLWAEFEELDRLVRSAPVSSSHAGAGQTRHRSGRDDHLEQGVYKRPRRPRRPS